MKKSKALQAGIVSFGWALPRYKITVSQLEAAYNIVLNQVSNSTGVHSKSVADWDQDAVTLGISAAHMAIERSSGDAQKKIRAFFMGSESHPYAVKPSITTIADALGLSAFTYGADMEFACKAGTQAFLAGAAYVESGITPMALAIGSDTAQAKPGDMLDFATGAGAAAIVIGRKNCIARVQATASYCTDTPDFWRRDGQLHPTHAGKFTADPGYFHHTLACITHLQSKVSVDLSKIDHVVAHSPNAKFPKKLLARLGWSSHLLRHSLLAADIGNTYSASSLLGLCSVLEHAGVGEHILVVSYGSGAGSDCILLETTSQLLRFRKRLTKDLRDSSARLQEVSFSKYLQLSKGM